MTNKTCPSQSLRPITGRGAKEQLYHLIRKQVKRMNFSRLLINPDEVVSDAYMLLIEKRLPDFETAEFRFTLRKAVKRILWDRRRPVRPMLDVDELDEDEHPFYEMDFYSEEVEFEIVFEKFCESFPEPKRTVFKYSRLTTKQDIAALLGISRNEIARIIKSMPDHFRDFLEHFNSR